MRIPGPGDVIRLAGQLYQTAEQAVGLLPRVVALVGRIDPVVDRVDVLVSKADALIASVQTTATRADALVTDVEALQLRVHGIVDQTAAVVNEAQALTHRTAPLLDTYEPALEAVAPIVSRIAETTSPAEVDAVVRLINALPGIVDKLDEDILPVLDTLSTVAPDLRDLLDVSRMMNELLGAVPGMGRVKRRAEEQQAEADAFEYRAGEEPASAPARHHAEPDGEPAANDGIPVPDDSGTTGGPGS